MHAVDAQSPANDVSSANEGVLCKHELNSQTRRSGEDAEIIVR